MRLRERWNELDTAMKIVVGLGVGTGVLFVAIPILLVLAAVVASFVLGLGDPEAGAPETPQAAFDFDLADDLESATITHHGGDTVQADRLTVEAGDRAVGWDGTGGVSAGDSTTVETNPGETVAIVWQGEEESMILAQFEAPDS